MNEIMNRTFIYLYSNLCVVITKVIITRVLTCLKERVLPASLHLTDFEIFIIYQNYLFLLELLIIYLLEYLDFRGVRSFPVEKHRRRWIDYRIFLAVHCELLLYP